MIVVSKMQFTFWYGCVLISLSARIFFSHVQSKIMLPSDVYYVSLDTSGNVSLYWSVNYHTKMVQFEIHLPLRVWDWFAIGFSDYGKYYPADYCLLWTNWKHGNRLEDIWTDEFGDVHSDQQQDCKDFEITFYKGRAKFTYSREFDTCDTEDYIIEDGTTHIIWLKGSESINDPTDLNVQNVECNGMQRTQLLKNPISKQIMKPRDRRIIEIRSHEVAVPNTDTTYWCRTLKLPNFLSRRHHIIQFESVIQEGNEGLVHHMEVFHCEAAPDVDISLYSGSCTDPKRPKDTEVCKKVMAAWAMGATAFLYPQEAGLPIGGEDFNKYIMLEVHYNNPELKSDYIDSSGMRLYVTPTLRKYDAGVLELGLEYTDKMAIPPKQDSFTLSGYCTSECTAVSIPPQGITIFGSQLHTHLTGIQALTRHIRDGRELLELNRDNHYSTHFQEIRLLKRPVRVLPGDALITTCSYDTRSRNKITLGGFAISDEMCVNYVHYYPRIDLEVCKSSISYQTLFTYFQYMNEWENQETSTDYGISTNYGNIQWTPERAKDLHQLYEDMTLSMQCNASTGYRFPGIWENVPLTRVSYSLPPTLRQCKRTHHNV